MIRGFLSHSSNDKDAYIRIVAERLGKQFVVFDEYTFEAGMKPLEEILNGLDVSQLFVVFLSNHALQSEWVKQEIIEAKFQLSRGNLKRIFPIIIDPKITYSDERIPNWLKNEYNLKLVSQPTVAARRIKQRLRELSWQLHPKLEERQKIFVGRNDQIKALEERIDDFDLSIPTCIVSSGIKSIGRRSFLRHSLIKSNVIRDSYSPPLISLGRHESLEDFLIKVHDLGISKQYDLTGMLEKSVELKINIATDIIREVIQAKELIFIIDDGCLINYGRDIEDWFKKIVKNLSPAENVIFAIASSKRPHPRNIKKTPEIYSIELPELKVSERKGLFKRYIELENINLSLDDFNHFCGLLYGYPEQAIFSVDLIKDLGIVGAKKESYQIQEYNTEKASIALQKYQSKEDILEFIYLLSEFEVISFDFLYDIVDEKEYSHVLNDLMARAVIDYVGIEREFIRLNDAVRDYIRRNRFGISTHYKNKLQKHVEEFIQEENIYDRDASDYIYSLKSLMMEGKEIPQKFLIPSHFLRTMRDLYQIRRHYDRVVELADIILAKENALETTIKSDIQYYLCLALARRKEPRFLKEVQKVFGPEHNFLLGFYYRLLRRDKDALHQLKKAVVSPVTAVRARRELVQVYLYMEDFEKAIDLARDNYVDNRKNPYFIQSYFNCLINLDNHTKNKSELRNLIDELYEVGSDQALEMGMTAESLFFTKCNNDKTSALNKIDDAINTFPTSPYPIITKFDILLRYKDIDKMKETLLKMETLANRKRIYKETVSRAKCLYYACIGDTVSSSSIINKELRNLPDLAKERLINRAETLCGMIYCEENSKNDT